MCGVWGQVSSARDGHSLSQSQAEACLHVLRHRGPDGSGLLRTDRVALGHRRLAVLDPTDAARQPMTSPDGRLSLVVNGEIYNHVELRPVLAAAGHRFAGTGDTEVLLAALREWGVDGLSRLNGMFAFAAWDHAEQSLLLGRDRLGIKPLYYLLDERRLAFCSEPKGLLPLLDRPPEPDLAAVSAFLSLRHVPAPASLFAGIRQLPAGHWLRWQDGRVSTGSWWRLAGRRPGLRGMRGLPGLPWRRPQQLRRLVADAVRLWARSDAPIGTYLSGGLDSSVLAYEVRRQLGPAAALTAEYDVPDYSEVADAAAVADRLGVPLEVVPASAGVAPADLAELVRLRDHPLGMHNEVALVRLAEAAAAGGVKVVLCGEGADELFGGYGRLSRLPFELGRRRLRPAGRAAPGTGGWRRHVRSPALRLLLEDYSYLPLDTKHRLLRPEIAAALAEDADLLRGLQAAWDAAGRVRLHRRLTHFLVTVHLPGLLAVLDAEGMARGIEARTPFLDHRVVEWAYRLPQRAKVRWRAAGRLRALRETPAEYSERRDITKWVLRRAYADVLPDRVLTRAKQPFPSPLREWLASPAAAGSVRLVLDDGARLHRLLDPVELRRWWASEADGHPTFGRQAWLLLNLEVWLREYFPNGVRAATDRTTKGAA